MVDDADDGATPAQPASPATLRGVGRLGDDARRSDAGAPLTPPAPPVRRAPSHDTVELHQPARATVELPAPRVTAELAEVSPDPAARYRFGEVIGEGGMGEVVLARDEHIGGDVAVKRIRGARPSPDQVARFIREARVQGGLEHPAVVPVHDLGTDRDGRPFFVMKRLSGTTLLELLHDLRTGNGDQAAERRRMLRAFVDVCLAIELAHSRGVVHRDLKPANIMLGDFGEVYVLDWGVARAFRDPGDPGDPGDPRDSDDTPRSPPGDRAARSGLELTTGETQLGTVLGTPAYMAPEQLAGDRAGPTADIYALGCILYEITAGEPWHVGHRSVGEALSEPAARPSAKSPDVAPELDAICERATQADPDARFGSARALGDAVQAYLDGDRDVVVRKELAQHHLAEARAALASGASDAARRAAMRAAGRALALDPTATEAAELVTRLLLEPPREVPEEVERRLALIDADTARHQGRISGYAMLCYFGFVPLLLWSGVRDLRLLVAYVVLAAAGALQLQALSRRREITRGAIYVNACINAALIALVARLIGPLLVTPAVAATTLVAYTAHPRFGKMSVLATILGASVAVPWGLEAAGVLAATYSFTPAGGLLISSPNLTLSRAPVHVAFALLLVILLTAVGLLSRALSRRQREAARRLELQAWHLAQVVPSAGTR